MVRKRYPWQRRPDRRRHRRRLPPPTSGWKLDELAALAHVPRRTIADYLQRGLLTAPPFRGTATRYDREHLLRVLAIRRARLEGERSLAAIKQRLDRMGVQAIEAWVTSGPLSVETAAALGHPAHAPSDAAHPPPTASAGTASPNATWTRCELLPGLELSARTDAPPVVHKLAEHLRSVVLGLLEGGLGTGHSPSK